MFGSKVSWLGRGHSQGQVGRDALSVGRVVRGVTKWFTSLKAKSAWLLCLESLRPVLRSNCHVFHSIAVFKQTTN